MKILLHPLLYVEEFAARERQSEREGFENGKKNEKKAGMTEPMANARSMEFGDSTTFG